MEILKGIQVAAFMVLILAVVPVDASIGGAEIRGQAASETTGAKGNLNLSSGTVSWHPQNFAGLFYDVNYEFGNENLIILDSSSLIGKRTIQLDKLIYTTSPDNKLLNVVKYPFYGNCNAAILAGLQGFEAGSMSSECGKYRIVGWQGEIYVGIKNKTNKLSPLIIEQDSYERKTLSVGETWEIGSGWALTAQAIDAKANPRQVWFVLSKDGIKKDDVVVTSGTGGKPIYTYVEKNLAGEIDVPVFVTYVDNVFAGATSDMVQLRYTWAIDTNVTQVKAGDRFGVFTVTNADESRITLKNAQSIVLEKNSAVNLMGKMIFRVADSDTLRFYPVTAR